MNRMFSRSASLLGQRSVRTLSKVNKFPASLHTPLFSRWFHQGRCLFNETKEAEAKEDAKDAEPEAEPPKVDIEAEHKKVLEEKEAAIKDANDRLLRTLADMQNLRDRSKREVEAATKYSHGEMAKVLLEVSDNLSLALKSAADDATDSNPKLKAFYEGVEMTEKVLMGCFGKYGIVRMDAAGAKFDPNFHDCLYEYVDPNGRPGTVGQVVKDGYMIKDRVLRPAQVGAIKGKYVEEEGEAPKE